MNQLADGVVENCRIRTLPAAAGSDALPNETQSLQLVNVRAELLATTKLLNDVSLDRYSFVRDAYLARRQDQVYDGAPPLEKFEDEGADPAPANPSPKKGN